MSKRIELIDQIKSPTSDTLKVGTKLTYVNAIVPADLTDNDIPDWNAVQSVVAAFKVVADIASLQDYADSAESILVSDTNQGGEFYYTTASLTADGGTIFAATGKGSGYWVRVFTGPVSMGWFGAKGDGSTNDLVAINNAYTNYAGFEFDFNDNTFLINPVDPTYPTGFFNGGIKPKDNSTTRFIGGAKLTMATTTANAYVFFNLTGTTNVTIRDGDVMGDVATHAGSSGEDGYGYFVVGATNPQLINCKASFCWGDGFYYGSGTTGGVLANAIADNNRRNGLSIVSWTKGLVLGGIFQNTGQTVLTSPGYGIDIEPDGKGTDTINVELIGVQTYNNSRGGLQVVPGSMTNVLYTRPTFNVIIKGYMSLQDGNSGALRFAYPPLTATGIRPTIPIYGKITVTDATIQQSVGRGVDFAHWDPGAPDVQLDNLTVIDCNTIGSTATNEQQCGVVVFLDVADIAVQTTTGRITINNAKIIDTRATPLMLVPIWMNCGAGQSIDNVTIKDVVSSGQISTSNGPTVLTRTTNASITYSIPPKKDITGNLTIQSGAYAGVSLASTNSSVTTLPLAATSIGLEYPFENRYAVTYQIRPNAADHIQDYNLNGTGDVVLRAIGDSVTLKCVDANTWRVMRKSGKVTPLGFTPGALSKGFGIYASAAPTTGAWVVNDLVYNSTPSVGQPFGWICTVAGSPGTWVAIGVLGLSTIGTSDIAANAVTYAKLQAMTTNKLLGSGASGTAVAEITLGTGLSFTGSTLNASGGAPATSKYIVQGTTDASLTNAQFLGALSTGIVKNTTTTGVLSIATAGTDYLLPTGSAAALTGLPLTTGVTGILPIANGGTGSATQNFVDLTTTQASIGGVKTFTSVAHFTGAASGLGLDVTGGYAGFTGGISTLNSGIGLGSGPNMYANGGASATNTTNAAIIFGGASETWFRLGTNGATSNQITPTDSYASFIVGSSPVTTGSSGAHPFFANMVVNKIGTITLTGGSTLTNTATLFVGPANTSGTNNYGIYSQGNFALAGSTSGVITTSVQAVAGTYALQYPSATPTTGQVMAYGAPMTWVTPMDLATTQNVSGVKNFNNGGSTSINIGGPAIGWTNAGFLTRLIQSAVSGANDVYLPSTAGTLALIGDLNNLKSYTVATLPVSPTQGSIAYVTDALTPTFLVAVVAGGSTKAPVFYNGSAWVSF